MIVKSKDPGNSNSWLNGQNLDGRNITVNEAQSRGSGGGGDGGGSSGPRREGGGGDGSGGTDGGGYGRCESGCGYSRSVVLKIYCLQHSGDQ